MGNYVDEVYADRNEASGQLSCQSRLFRTYHVAAFIHGVGIGLDR